MAVTLVAVSPRGALSSTWHRVCKLTWWIPSLRRVCYAIRKRTEADSGARLLGTQNMHRQAPPLPGTYTREEWKAYKATLNASDSIRRALLDDEMDVECEQGTTVTIVIEDDHVHHKDIVDEEFDAVRLTRSVLTAFVRFVFFLLYRGWDKMQGTSSRSDGFS